MSHMNYTSNSDAIIVSESDEITEYCKQLTVFPPKAEGNPHAGKCKEFVGGGHKDKIYLFATHSVINTH